MDVNGVFGICTQGRALLTHHVRKRVHIIYSALQYGCTVSSPYLHNKHTNISIHAKQPA